MTNAIVPRSVDDIARMAKMAFASGLAKVTSPEAAGVIIMAGMELGLTPMQALLGMHLVDGKPTLAADTLVALVVRRVDLCEVWRVVETTTEQCLIETRRRGHEMVRRVWTMEMARRAGLTNRGPWRQYPETMLRHRCATALAREVYPDVVLGMYDPEELGAESAPPVEVVATSQALPRLSPPAPDAEDHDEERAAIVAKSKTSPYERGESLLAGARTLAALAGAWTIVRAEILGRCGPGERTALTALKDARKAELTPPPTGTDGAPTAAPAEGASAETSTGDAATAELPAWTRSTDGQREHVVAKTDAHEIRASALRWAPLLGDGYVWLCAQRVCTLTGGQQTEESALRWCRTPIARARRVA